MIPTLSTVPHSASFEDKRGKRSEPLIAYSSGSPQLGLATPLYGTQWTARYESGEVRLRREEEAEYVVVFSAPNITFLTLAFDQQMQPVVAYIQAGEAKLRWYNSVLGAYDTLVLPAGTTAPHVALDLREQVFLIDADVILSYVRDNNLYVRVQRENYGVERLFKANAGRELVRFGRNKGNRLQWLLLPPTE